MEWELNSVREFMKKHGYPLGIKPGDDPKIDWLRADLITEEAKETVEAIGKKDMRGIADGLADLLYVIYGAALTYGIPIEQVFDAVHQSNMTKAVRKEGDLRLRDKGADWVPPNLEGIGP